MANNYWIAQQKKNAYKNKLLKMYPELLDESGIYVLTRLDEMGLKYSYVGQSLHCLSRVAEHLLGYTQHIDRSLKAHKLYSADNIFGWKVEYFPCEIKDLDECEHCFILKYANAGYQMLNKTAGKQGEGKVGIADNQGGLGYRKGVEYGYQKAIKEIKEYFDKYLDFEIKNVGSRKKGGDYKEIFIKKYNEFAELLKGKE